MKRKDKSMLNSKKLFFLFLLSLPLLFWGCGAAPQPPKAPEPLPAWVNLPVTDDAQYVYGVAIEADRESAVKAALSEMVSKLGVSIESSFESQQRVDNYHVDNSSTNKIKSDVAKIQINNYEVIKSHRISYKEFAVMIKTDKEKFAQGLEESLSAQKSSMELRLASVTSKDTLSKYNLKQELSKEADAMLSTVLIAAKLSSAKKFDKGSYLKFISLIKADFIQEQKSLNFYVSGDANSVSFVKHLKNFLAQKNFSVSGVKKANSVLVKVQTSDSIGSGSIAVLKINIDVVSQTQNIGGKSIILKERYNGSKSSVYKNASIHFEQEIKELGLNEALGVELNH